MPFMRSSFLCEPVLRDLNGLATGERSRGVSEARESSAGDIGLLGGVAAGRAGRLLSKTAGPPDVVLFDGLAFASAFVFFLRRAMSDS